MVETKAGINGVPIIDLNRDKEAPENEPEAAVPWNQKFSNYEKCAIPAITINCLIKRRKLSFGQTRLGIVTNGAH